MSKKTMLFLGVIVLAVLLGAGLLKNNNQKPEPLPATEENQTARGTPGVKELSMESFVEFVDGQPKPQFSLREIKVKKGDLVRITIINTKGNHDFKIDEFNVYAETPLNQEVLVEFKAEKLGSFIYYCTQPGHRAAGHWGTLQVTE